VLDWAMRQLPTSRLEALLRLTSLEQADPPLVR
jgi:hypothetical protein